MWHDPNPCSKSACRFNVAIRRFDQEVVAETCGVCVWEQRAPSEQGNRPGLYSERNYNFFKYSSHVSWSLEGLIFLSIYLTAVVILQIHKMFQFSNAIGLSSHQSTQTESTIQSLQSYNKEILVWSGV